MDDLPDDTTHKCDRCCYRIAEVFNNLEELKKSLTVDTKNAFVHIAGYATRKDEELPEDELLLCTTFLANKFGTFTNEIDRGFLNIPHDRACQWTFFSFILFKAAKD